MQSVNIAVLGATGVVGEAVLEILAERKFPIKKLFPLASKRSQGSTVMFNNKPHWVENVADFDFSQVDVAIFSAGASVSELYAPKAAAAGCVVIDNTSQFRSDADVPLVVPEVNPHALEQYKGRRIIANPNCSTIQMVVALKPIYDAVGITRINFASYQSVSGAGKEGIDELVEQTAALLNGRNTRASTFPVQIAFNVIPHIDVFEDNGYTKEEMKVVRETRKIFGDNDIMINPTAVRVPVFFGHSEAVHIETRDKLTLEHARELLQKAPGVAFVDERTAKGYPTPVTHAANNNAVFVGRLREDISHPRGLSMWIVSDNVRKGAALNAVQIAELLLDKNYIPEGRAI
jgi:aspartate-semialdehyde dehydrogenase